MTVSTNIYTAAYNHYRTLGLDPLPIPYHNGLPSKVPVYDNWQTKASNHDFTADECSSDCNIGILLGGDNNVTDIDCDSPEAVAVSGDIIAELMKKTGKTMIFGHELKPRSHYIFFTDRSLPSVKISDPTDNQCVIEYRCVTTDGSRGLQTVFPPSVWYEPKKRVAEEIRLETDSGDRPVYVDASKLYSGFR